MRKRAPHTLTTIAIAALVGAVAMRYGRPLTDLHKPAEVLAGGHVDSTAELSQESLAAEPVDRLDTLGRGETLRHVFERGGLSGDNLTLALLALTPQDHRRVPAGMPVRISGPDSTPTEISLQFSPERVVRLTRGSTGWTAADERLPWTTDTIAVQGAIRSTLLQAVNEAATELPRAVRSELTWDLADVFEYRVDMSRDLQAGDEFRVLVERSTAPTGAVRLGKIVAASFSLSGNEVSAVRFARRDGSASYFDQSGKSMRAAFLRAPLNFRRISSAFGLRRHPILGIRKQHKGTDYAASSGTPVRAIGDGVVTRAGWSGGYGNVLEIRHRNGYVTRYGHLRGFARGVRAGTRVSIGSTVAYVGSTGLSTAPHLHFEVLVNGVHRDPRTALRSASADPIAAADRPQFERLRATLFASFDRPTDTQVARLVAD